MNRQSWVPAAERTGFCPETAAAMMVLIRIFAAAALHVVRSQHRVRKEGRKEGRKEQPVLSMLRTIRKEECLHGYGSCCDEERKKGKKKRKRQAQRKERYRHRQPTSSYACTNSEGKEHDSQLSSLSSVTYFYLCIE